MADQLTRYIEDISALMETRLWIKGRDLKAQKRKAGRRLPRKIRRDLQQLIDANMVNQNPKLARMVDDAKLTKAHANVVTHLETLNPRAAMWNMVQGIVASIALALIVTFVLVMFVMVQRGLI